MNAFFDKLKDSCKECTRRIRATAKAAADKIDESAAELSRRSKAAVAGMKQAAADAFRSFKSAFTRSAGTADSGAHQNAADTNSGTNTAQTESRASDRNDEADSARHTGTSGEAKTATGNAGFQHEHSGRHCRATARSFIVHAVDILAGLLFFTAVVIALKPDLLSAALHIPKEATYQNDIPRVIEMSEKIGSYLIQIKITQTISPELTIARNVFVALFLALYIVLKIAVILLAKSQSPQKIVSALMIALTMLACTLLAENFWIFAAICLIASFAFAFSCGFPPRTIFRKFAAFAALALCWYVEAHILANYDNCQETLREIGKALVQFGEKAAAFFAALRLPLQA